MKFKNLLVTHKSLCIKKSLNHEVNIMIIFTGVLVDIMFESIKRQ